ncbi:unnamed protein product, partial [Heterosigma akashiwo]
APGHRQRQGPGGVGRGDPEVHRRPAEPAAVLRRHCRAVDGPHLHHGDHRPGAAAQAGTAPTVRRRLAIDKRGRGGRGVVRGSGGSGQTNYRRQCFGEDCGGGRSGSIVEVHGRLFSFASVVTL